MAVLAILWHSDDRHDPTLAAAVVVYSAGVVVLAVGSAIVEATYRLYRRSRTPR
jgi:hypothetical protein